MFVFRKIWLALFSCYLLLMTIYDGYRLTVLISKSCFVWGGKSNWICSDFKIICWVPCSNMAFAIFLFQEKVSSLYNAGFISLFPALPRLLTQSSDFNVFCAHLMVSVTLPTLPFFLGIENLTIYYQL